MITTWSTGAADANMDEQILVELGAIVARHPWWRARARLTLNLLQRAGKLAPCRVLDAGCGWGVTLRALETQQYVVTGMDISRDTLDTLDTLDTPDRTLIEADLTQPLPEGHPTYDVVLALDVIEHLDDDRGAIGALGRLVAPGGVLMISVPALPEFFTEFDQIQGHRRRYTPETLALAMSGTDLTLDRIFWWGQWLVPILKKQRAQPRSQPGDTLAQIYRRYLRLPPWPLPLLLRAGFAWERDRALNGSLTQGTSLFAVAQRR